MELGKLDIDNRYLIKRPEKKPPGVSKRKAQMENP